MNKIKNITYIFGFYLCSLEKTVEVRTTVLSDKLKSAITRQRPVELVISCEYNREKRQSSKVAIKSIIGKIGGYVSRQGKPLDIQLSYVNDKGEVINDSNIKKALGKCLLQVQI